MRKKIVLLIAALFFAITSVLGVSVTKPKSVTAASTFEKVNFINGVVTASELNVRQGPAQKFPVVCVLKKGQSVKVFGKITGWYAVYEPGAGCVGAVSSDYVKMTGAMGKAPAKAPAKSPAKAPAKAPVQKQTPAKKPVAQNPAPPANNQGETQGATKEDQTLLNLVNKARADAGVGSLSFDMELMKVARLKAKDMVDNNYFAHQSPTYGSPFDMMRQFGISFKTAGENIAGNQTVEGAFDAWMKSEGHRKNILNGNFNYCGFGIVTSPTYGKVLVQQFIGK